MKAVLTTHTQADAYTSAWPWTRRAKRALWICAWSLTCRWTPKPFNAWRILVLRAFGARVAGQPFVHASVRIHFPPYLTLHHRACLGENVVVYCLAPVGVHAGATVAQETYLCTGTHDFFQPHLPLQTAAITIGRDAFVGARAFVLPGITVGARGIVGACAVVTRDVEEGMIVAGNPARVIGERTLHTQG